MYNPVTISRVPCSPGRCAETSSAFLSCPMICAAICLRGRGFLFLDVMENAKNIFRDLNCPADTHYGSKSYSMRRRTSWCCINSSGSACSISRFTAAEKRTSSSSIYMAAAYTTCAAFLPAREATCSNRASTSGGKDTSMS